MAERKYQGLGRTFNEGGLTQDEETSSEEQGQEAKVKSPKKKRVRNRTYMKGLSPSERFQARDGGYEWYMGNTDSDTR